MIDQLNLKIPLDGMQQITDIMSGMVARFDESDAEDEVTSFFSRKRKIRKRTA